jgi:hypothetical protein
MEPTPDDGPPREAAARFVLKLGYPFFLSGDLRGGVNALQMMNWLTGF